MKSNVKILLITGSFPPAFAPRMGFLCKHIAKHTNWTIDCLCSNRKTTGSHAAVFSHLDGYVKDIYMYKNDDGVNEVDLKTILKYVYSPKYLYLLFLKVFYRIFGRGLNLGVRKIIRKIYSQGKSYDLILTSSGGDRVYEHGKYAARLFKCPIIHDFRDIMEQVWTNDKIGWQRKAILTLRNRAISNADQVVCTTRGQYNVLKKYNPRITLIHNGYDPEIFYPCKPVKTNTFDIVYIGSIYTGHCPIELVCDALITFCEKHKDANVLFYSLRQVFDANILPLIEYSHVSNQFLCMKTCQQTEMGTAFQKASVLLVMHHTIQGGVECISSKVYEYLASNRPILCVKNKISDYLEIVDIIQNTNAGVVVDSKEGILEFLEKKYDEWRRYGVVEGTTINEEVYKYSRASECDEYIELINNVVDNHTNKKETE